MSLKFKSSPFQKCPRCKTKCMLRSKKCHECGLVFERLNYTSNKTAKRNILKGRRSEVLMVTDFPYDAKKSTALILCGLLGFSGAHNFYLGRFWKASFVLLGLLLSLTTVLLTEYGLYDTTLYTVIRYFAILPGASVLIFWIWDFIGIFLERYKIPVSIDENFYDLKSKIIENDDKNEQISLKNEKKPTNKTNKKKNKTKNKTKHK